MPIIKTVGIFPSRTPTPPRRLVPKLLDWLRDRGIAVRLDERDRASTAGDRRHCRAKMCPRAAT